MIDRLTAAQITLVAYVTTGLERLRAGDRQRGVVSIEYIVLGVAIIAIVGVLAKSTAVQTALETAFKNLFTKASS